jgi:hypothetical protein
MNKFYGVIYFDPEKIQMDITNFTGQGTIDIQQKDGNLLINITNLKDINVREEILGIPFSGDARLLLLGESKGWINNGWQKFAVGNLSQFVPHTK